MANDDKAKPQVDPKDEKLQPYGPDMSDPVQRVAKAAYENYMSEYGHIDFTKWENLLLAARNGWEVKAREFIAMSDAYGLSSLEGQDVTVIAPKSEKAKKAAA